MRYSISTVLVLAAASAGIASGAKCDKDNAVDYKTYYTAKNPIGAEVSLETFAKTYSLDVWKLVDELDGKTGIKKTDSVECTSEESCWSFGDDFIFCGTVTGNRDRDIDGFHDNYGRKINATTADFELADGQTGNLGMLLADEEFYEKFLPLYSKNATSSTSNVSEPAATDKDDESGSAITRVSLTGVLGAGLGALLVAAAW